MKFTLEIELGNAAMETGEHIGRALSLIGRAFAEGQDGPEIRDAGKIKDFNGNLVGKWQVSNREQSIETAAKFGLAIVRGLLTDSQLDFRATYDCEITRMTGSNVSVREASSRIFACLRDINGDLPDHQRYGEASHG